MTLKENLSDLELLQSMRDGDESAFVLLYRRRQAGIYRFALQMCGSAAMAEDVTQDVFLMLIHQSQAFDPARGSLSAFLYGVARNQLLRRFQRERFYTPLESNVDEEVSSLIEVSGPLEDLSRTEMIDTVRKAVLALPQRYREIVVLCELEEMSYVEAAQVLGCAIGTVRSRLHRARALLIEKLQPVNNEKAATAEVKTSRCFA